MNTDRSSAEQTAIDLVPPQWQSEIKHVRLIDGRLCGVQKFLHSTGLLVNLTFCDDGTCQYAARYCYEFELEALLDLMTWDGHGDPTGAWLKEKVSERLGPGTLANRFSFVGQRHANGCEVRVEYLEGRSVALNPRHDLYNHSPDGFEWGYSGSGPAQLALAMAAMVVPSSMAIRYHQDVKNELIIPLTGDRWSIADQLVLSVILHRARQQGETCGTAYGDPHE